MYAIVRSGGKQYKVSEGDVIDVELVGNGSGSVELTPVLIVDDKGQARSGRDISGAKVTGKIVGESKGPKVDIFKYRSKTRYRRNQGHRQRYSQVEIAKIRLTKGRSTPKTKKSEE
jgi:large subunit ribosomal protein L21